uniref:Post-GPI attachment to proteins factor 3 n=1 Tax=Dendroctonus ponderosae TaxID=77166 RepID=A0AAR5PNF3_DENPD
MKPIWSRKPALLLLPLVAECLGSSGDRNPYYRRCLAGCQASNCSQDGGQFVTDYRQPGYLRLLRWGCADECEYQCMWSTVEKFQENQLNIPQFYGKWPFRRVLGIQEPASMLFSLLNLFMHLMLLHKFRNEVRAGAPLRWLWLFYGAVCCNAWIWSAVFHSRDLPWTEWLDYVGAFSIILVNCYAMCVRVLPHVLGAVFPKRPQLVLLVSLGFLLFFLKHAAYLSRGRFDYAYNIMLNINVGALTAIGWLVWSVKCHPKPPYVHSCQLYVIFSGLVLLLELLDSPPWFFVVDYHALWHLATAPPLVYIYRFAMEDCRYLRSMERRGLLGGINGGAKAGMD